jgi:soluble lytic murein transglycosylase-like protein
MTRSIAIAAALAAAMTSFAAHAHEAPRDGGKIMAEALAAAKKKKPAAAKAETHKPVKKAASRIVRHGRRVAHTSKPGHVAKVDSTKTASIKKNAPTPRQAVEDRSTDDSAGPSVSSTNAYGGIIDRYATAYGVAPSLARAVVEVESGYNAHKTGRAGEIGLMQIKPATARMLGYSGSVKELYSPETNIKWGMKYLGMAQDVGNGTTCGTLLKYNAGHAAKRMNPISAAYCGRVEAALGDAAT